MDISTNHVRIAYMVALGGDKSRLACPRVVQCVHLRKEALVFRTPLSLVMLVSKKT